MAKKEKSGIKPEGAACKRASHTHPHPPHPCQGRHVPWAACSLASPVSRVRSHGQGMRGEDAGREWAGGEGGHLAEPRSAPGKRHSRHLAWVLGELSLEPGF